MFDITIRIISNICWFHVRAYVDYFFRQFLVFLRKRLGFLGQFLVFDQRDRDWETNKYY